MSTNSKFVADFSLVNTFFLLVVNIFSSGACVSEQRPFLLSLNGAHLTAPKVFTILPGGGGLLDKVL